jgi:hypothetical protein
MSRCVFSLIRLFSNAIGVIYIDNGLNEERQIGVVLICIEKRHKRRKPIIKLK